MPLHSYFSIRADLATAMAVRDTLRPPTLDGILASLLVDSGMNPDEAVEAIPLANFQGVWCGSSMLAEPMALSPRLGTRPDTIRFLHSMENDLGRDPSLIGRISYEENRNGELVGDHSWNVRSGNGPYKNSLTDYSLILSRRVWWFGYGDFEQVQRMVGYGLGRIGAKRYRGPGKLMGQPVIQQIDKAPDHPGLLTFSGKPTRPIPLTIWDTLNSATVGIPMWKTWKPPYWSEDNATHCRVPGGVMMAEGDIRREYGAA